MTMKVVACKVERFIKNQKRIFFPSYLMMQLEERIVYYELVTLEPF